MSSDHKPSRPDERRRIEKAGGKVMIFGGVPRVAAADYEERCRLIKKAQCMQGVAAQRPPVALAVSRAFGDKELKEPGLVIPTPEITKIAVTPECEVIVMACDGIWDVLTNQEVVELAERHPNQPDEAASAIVTSSFKNGSQDNLTVVVIFVNFVNKK